MEMRNEFVAVFLVSATLWNKHDDFVEPEELLESILGRKFEALLWHNVVEVAAFHQLSDDIKAALELAMDVDLWEGGPLSVELQPLSDALVTEDIERLDVAVAASVDVLDEAASELAAWGIECALDEHHAGVCLDQVVDFAESKLLLLLEESLDKSVKLGDFLCQLLGRHA